MTMRLEIFAPNNYEWGVAWDDEGCPGLWLGEKANDAEHKAATAAARQVGRHPKASDQPLVWETYSEATKALRAARAAVKAVRDKRPWPKWAIKAKAEGWRPPRGWKPGAER